MDNRLKYIGEHLEEMLIGPDEKSAMPFSAISAIIRKERNVATLNCRR